MFAGGRELAADGGLHLVIVVQHGGRAQELEGAHHGVSENVGDGERGPAEGDLDEDHAYLRQGGVGERRFGIGTRAAGHGAVNGGGQPDGGDEYADRGRLRQHRLGPQQQISSGVDGDGAVVDGAGGRGAFHGAGQPSGEWDLRGFAGGGDEQQDGEDGRLRAAERGKSAIEGGGSGPV